MWFEVGGVYGSVLLMPGDKQRSGLHPGGRKSQARKEAMGLEVKEEGYRRVGVVAAGD
jgi:hypothetical protein